MSEQFEEHGSLTVTSGTNTFTIDTEFDDTSDAYTFTPGNSADVIAFYNALNGTGHGTLAGTLVLNDGASTPDIPAVTGDANHAGFSLTSASATGSATIPGVTGDADHAEFTFTAPSATVSATEPGATGAPTLVSPQHSARMIQMQSWNTPCRLAQVAVTEVEYRIDGGAWQTGEFTRQGIKPVTTYSAGQDG